MIPTMTPAPSAPSMTEREIERRLHGLCPLADRPRAPGYRHTPEAYVVDRDEICDSARRLCRALTVSWPKHEVGAVGPERRPRPTVPAAVLRHRERIRTARSA